METVWSLRCARPLLPFPQPRDRPVSVPLVGADWVTTDDGKLGLLDMQQRAQLARARRDTSSASGPPPVSGARRLPD